ncbi:MAG: hypothetical protein WCP60_09365 [bacterium]
MSVPGSRLLLAVIMMPLPVALGVESSNPPVAVTNQMTAAKNSLQDRLGEVSALVKALPGTGDSGSPSERLKKAALEVALEQAKACITAASDADARTLLEEIGKAATLSADTMLAPGKESSTASALRPPRASMHNPYLDRMVSGATLELKTPDIRWPKETANSKAFDSAPLGINCRTLAIKMQGWLWLLVNPASPLRGNPEVLARFLRIAHAYADALDVEGGSFLKMDKSTAAASIVSNVDGVFDRYALSSASSALREFSEIYPDLLLPSQRALWDRAMHTAGSLVSAKIESREGSYAVADLSQALALINFGLYLHDDACLAKAKLLIEAQSKNIYPDGGIAANDHQNDANLLHDYSTAQMAEIYEITRDPKLEELLRKTEWYGPVSSGKMGEFWTVASWKDLWNRDDAPAGGEPVAALTSNPYLRGMLDKPLHGLAPLPMKWAENRASISWYRDDVKPLPLPDNYTIIDRNINGPRAWYGRFNYAATLRPIPPTEPGLSTLMGAHVLSSEGKIGQILMGVYPRIRLKGETLNPDGRPIRQAYAWPTSNLQSSLVMGRSFSAISASYILHQYQGCNKGHDTDWKGRQLWLGLPDRIIGLLEVEPTREEALAWGVEGMLRLGIGGTIYGKPTSLQAQGEGIYRYGDLTITLLGHNFGTIKPREVPFRYPSAPVTELTLLDDKGAADPKGPSNYPLGTNYWFLVEIRPSWVKAPASVRQLDKSSGIVGFEADVAGKQFFLMNNLGSSELAYELPHQKGDQKHTLRTSLSDEIQTNAPASLTLKPRELAVLVTSPDSEDHLRGYPSFADMIAHP